MNRNEIREKLINLGASPKLLEMPAVMERLYCYYIDRDDFGSDIEIGFNGEIIIKVDEHGNGKFEITKKFEELEEGGARFINLSKSIDFFEQTGKVGVEYYIDEYGMDIKSYESLLGSGADPITILRTEDGFIEINGKKICRDHGDVILMNGERTFGWEMNKLLLTTYYPKTKEWFERRERNIGKSVTEETIEESRPEQQEENIEITSMKNRLDTLKKKYEEMEEKNATLIKEKETLQSMLKTALSVCEKIKNSRIGKIFFRGDLKQLPRPSDDHEKEI
jgi:hypothetical protein